MTLSAAFLEAVYAGRTDEVFLILLKIDHEDLASPIYIVNNTQNITSNAIEHIAFPFQLTMPDDVEDQLPAVSLTIDNVSRDVIQAVRELDSPPTVRIQVVLASSPDTIERGPYTLTLREVEYDQIAISGSLQPEDLLTEPAPVGVFSPGDYPGLF